MPTKQKLKPSIMLMRYIEVEFRQDSKRPAPGAFQLRPNERQLSVNSTSIHTPNQIAGIYSQKFGEPRPIGIAGPKISDYCAAAGHCRTVVYYDEKQDCWLFDENAIPTPAFVPDPKENNESHYGVNFLRTYDDYHQYRFAVHIAQASTYRLR